MTTSCLLSMLTGLALEESGVGTSIKKEALTLCFFFCDDEA